MTIFKSTNRTKINRLDKIKKEISNPKKVRNLNILLETDLLVEFKVKTVKEEITMTEVIMRAIKDYLKN